MICIKGQEITTTGSDTMLATNLTCLFRYFQKTNPLILRMALEAFQVITDKEANQRKKTNCYACRFCLCDAEGRSCQLGADKYSEACKLFEEA